MAEDTGILGRVRAAAAKRILFLPHAIKAMARPTPIISRSEVESVVVRGEVIEDYPEDVRGHSCLMLATPEGRAVHVVCSPKADYLAVISAYVPEPPHSHPSAAAALGAPVVGGLPREETLMECLHCKGRLVKGTAPFSVDRGGYHLHWDAVPAWVCTQCGEPLFEGREVDVIQEAIKALDRQNEKLLTAR